MRDFILHCTEAEIMLSGLAFFASIYLLFGFANGLLARKLLPALAPSLTQTLLEILVLIVWNEMHFYINPPVSTIQAPIRPFST